MSEDPRCKWKSALIDAAVVNWAYCAAHEDDPKALISALIAQIQIEANDPLISKPASDLLKRAEEAEMKVRDLQKRLDHMDYLYSGS